MVVRTECCSPIVFLTTYQRIPPKGRALRLEQPLKTLVLGPGVWHSMFRIQVSAQALSLSFYQNSLERQRMAKVLLMRETQVQFWPLVSAWPSSSHPSLVGKWTCGQQISVTLPFKCIHLLFVCLKKGTITPSIEPSLDVPAHLLCYRMESFVPASENALNTGNIIGPQYPKTKTEGCPSSLCKMENFVFACQLHTSSHILSIPCRLLIILKTM